MNRLWLVAAVLVLATACTTKKEPPPPSSLVMPGSRLLYNNGTESLWAICDRGSRIYLTNKGAAYVAPGACSDGLP
jgi:hypothetical protein